MTAPCGGLNAPYARGKPDLLRHFPRFLQSLGVPTHGVDLLARHFADLLDEPDDGMAAIAELIARERLREPWGRALAIDRAERLSRWIAPHVVGSRLLDLLCGDGAVGVMWEAISGNAVRLVERAQHRGVVDRPWAGRIHDLDSLAGPMPALCDTALLCTVLHHEEQPLDTLALAVRCSRHRVVIIENCLEPEYGADYHLLVDHLFNAGLFRTHLPCPGHHLSTAEWVRLCERFGPARVVDRCTEVPGIPLAHTLIVLDLEVTRETTARPQR